MRGKCFGSYGFMDSFAKMPIVNNDFCLVWFRIQNIILNKYFIIIVNIKNLL